MQLSKELTTVTPLSKVLALFMFILLPIIGFVAGVQYQVLIDKSVKTEQNKYSYPRTEETLPSVTPTSTITNHKTNFIENVIPNLSPTKAPGVRYEENGMMVYKDNNYGFLFRFPTSLILDSDSSSNWLSFLQEQYGTMSQRLLVTVEDYNKSLEEYVKKEDYSLYGQEESVFINKHAALLFITNQSQQDLCNEGDTEIKRRVNLAIIKGDGYVLTLLPNDSCDTYKTEWFAPIPQTVTFFK